MKSFSRKSRQSGDTIVEVIIAIAIISAVLMGAFVVTQHSTAAVRNGQERGEVLQLLQGQVEQVRALALSQTTPDNGIFADGEFCINPVSGERNPVSSGDDNGVCSNFQDLYTVSITYDKTTKVFTFNGDWDGVDGTTKSEQLTYRVYSGGAVALSSPTTPTSPSPSPSGSPSPSPSGSPSPSPSPTPGPPAPAPTPPPPPPSSGDAFFSGNGNCGKPGLPSCNTVSPTGSYHYFFGTYNKSQNADIDVIGCSWNWGDGTTDVYNTPAAACMNGAKVTHTFPTPPYPKPYPQDCNKTNYKIVLTMRVKNVSPNPTYTGYALEAYCAY